MVFIFGVATIFKYNQVKIFNRSITHPSITNKEYVGFFMLLAISFIIDGIRYSTNLPFQIPPENNFQDAEDHWVVGPHVIDAWLLVGSSLLRSVALMFLTLALNQQRLHRSSAAANPLDNPARTSSETEPLLRHPSSNPNFGINYRSHSYPGAGTPLFETSAPEDPISHEEVLAQTSLLTRTKEYLLSMASIIVIFWGLRLTILLLTIDGTRLGDSIGPKDTQSWPLLQSFGAVLQLSPLLYLTFVILVTPALPLNNSRSSRIYGPSATCKFVLLVSTCTTLIFWLEPSLVHRLLEFTTGQASSESRCIIFPYWWVDKQYSFGQPKVLPAHGWASTMDLIQWIGGMGVYGYFYFMKQEFTRNMEVNGIDVGLDLGHCI
jgi:hypothetical protein